MAAHAKPRPEANPWLTPQRLMQSLLVFVVIAPLAEFLHWGALASRRTEPCSHDNLFHSVLGLLDVHTSAYRQELDLFSRSAQQ